MSSSTAFLEVFDATRDGLYRLFRKATADESLTEDMVQECYLRLWENWANAADPKAYVFGIAHHLANEYYRRKSRDILQLVETLPDRENPEPADAAFIYKETKQRLYTSMKHLSPEKRAAFALIKEEERTYKEASEALGVPVSTLEKQIASGLKHLGKVLMFLLVACNKSNQSVNVSQQQFVSGSYVDAGDTLNSKDGSSNRAIKGTLKTGETYYLSSDHGDATINNGDTLVIQSGVTIYIVGPSTGATAIGTQDHAPGLVVNGTLLSLGTKAQPVLVTVQDPTLRSDPSKDPQDPSTDPAFKGYWGGIQGGTGSGDIILKWTRLEYMGGLTPLSSPVRPGAQRYGVWTQNPHCHLVVENCWLYGTANDCLRPAGSMFEIVGNTFEKVGITAGECVNVKSGSVGDIAYNLVIGGTGNAFKSANAGGLSPQSNMNCYNNTIVTTGYRQLKVGEGGSLDFENQGRGNCYNNLLVNCKFGLGIAGAGSSAGAADTANVHYGYTYNYGDSVSICSQFLPSGYITQAQPTDINGGNATTPGANNPLFVNYPLPVVNGINFIEADFVGSYDFHLRSGSPAIGKANTGFAAYGQVPIDPTFGVTTLLQPGKDFGAFQSDGTGNQH